MQVFLLLTMKIQKIYYFFQNFILRSLEYKYFSAFPLYSTLDGYENYKENLEKRSMQPPWNIFHRAEGWRCKSNLFLKFCSNIEHTFVQVFPCFIFDKIYIKCIEISPKNLEKTCAACLELWKVFPLQFFSGTCEPFYLFYLNWNLDLQELPENSAQVP